MVRPWSGHDPGATDWTERRARSAEGGPEGHGCHHHRGGATERAECRVLTAIGRGRASEVSRPWWPPGQGPASQGLLLLCLKKGHSNLPGLLGRETGKRVSSWHGSWVDMSDAGSRRH